MKYLCSNFHSTGSPGDLISVANFRNLITSLTVFGIFLKAPDPGVLRLGENLIFHLASGEECLETCPECTLMAWKPEGKEKASNTCIYNYQTISCQYYDF